MVEFLEELVEDGILVYMDVLIIFSQSMEDHRRHLLKVIVTFLEPDRSNLIMQGKSRTKMESLSLYFNH